MKELSAVDALIFFTVAVFQVMLAVGKPWGEYAWGGRYPGVLPTRLRRSSAASAVVVAAAGIVVLIEGGLLLSGWQSLITEVITWALAFLLLVSTAMNGFSESRKEKITWIPVNATCLSG